jgi:hypothetical protein
LDYVQVRSYKMCEEPDCYKMAKVLVYRNKVQKYVCSEHTAPKKVDKQMQLFSKETQR